MSSAVLNKKNRSKRLMSIDYLKAIAAILVIINHSLSLNQELEIGGPFWLSMAVPIFMILTGYTYTMSSEKKSINTFGQYFDRYSLWSKLLRILIPYLVIFIIEMFLTSIIPSDFQTESFGQEFPTLLLFLLGGAGPGSYYMPIMIQLVFLFPVMLFSFNKSPGKSIIFFTLIQIGFNIFSNFLPISNGIYRLLIFRYIVLILIGISFYYYKDRLNSKGRKIILALSLISIIYIYMVNYGGYEPVIFTKWVKTSLPTVFVPIAMVTFGMKYLDIKYINKFTNLLSLLGKASFHIFLVQKVYFIFRVNRIFTYFNMPILLGTTVSILICCTLGVGFYYLENKIIKAIATIKKT